MIYSLSIRLLTNYLIVPIKIRYQENQQRWAREHQRRNGIVFLVVADKLGSVAFFRSFTDYVVRKDCIHFQQGGIMELREDILDYLAEL